MSKKSNVHPDHYKTAGREPQGHDVVQKAERQKMRQEQAWLEKEAASHKPNPKAGKNPQPQSNEPEELEEEIGAVEDKNWSDKSGYGSSPNRPEVPNDQPDDSAFEKKPSAKQEARAAEGKESERARGRQESQAARSGENPDRHASSKSGKRSSAQKAEGWRHEGRRTSEPAPPSHKVAGASGKEPDREPVTANVEEDE